jgi:hypothetical protein
LQHIQERNEDKHAPRDAKTNAEWYEVAIYGVAKMPVGVPTGVQVNTNFVFARA